MTRPAAGPVANASRCSAVDPAPWQRSQPSNPPITVEPGSTGRSSSDPEQRIIGDRFDVTVVGPLAAWARPQPASLSLFPGQEGESQIVFALPREPFPRAGTLPFGVRVAPEADPGGTTVEEGRVTVGAFTDLAAEIVPQTSRASRVGRHDVIIENRGNARWRSASQLTRRPWSRSPPTA
jgi:hypothetical protein